MAMAMLLGMRRLLLSIPKTPPPFFFSTTSSAPILQFLEAECHFSPPQISKIVIAQKSLMRVRSTQTARQAVEFLREWGFTHSQLHSTILHYPASLTLRVDSHLKPTFDFLTTLGFPYQDLRILISRKPRVLGISLDGNMKPRMPFLEQLFGSRATLIQVLKWVPELLTMSVEKQLKPKLEILKKWGIQGELLTLLLKLCASSLCRIRIEELEIRIEYVRNSIGIVEGSKTFVYVVYLVVNTGPKNFEKKVKHLENLGLLKEEVQQLVTKQPYIFTLSTDKMQHNMDFLTETAGFQPNVVLCYGRLLHYSIENRLKPRLAIFHALCAMQQPTPNLIRMLNLSEKEFLQKVVECSPHASTLKEIYKRKANSTDVETS